MTVFDDFQAWYTAQCDDDWEHTYGVVIETLDNPGWWVKIDLRDTTLEGQPFELIEDGDSEADLPWIVCKVEGKQWHGMGDPSRLEELLSRFTSWAKSHPDWLAVPDEASLQLRDDREVWDLLGQQRGEEKCRVEDCDEWRIRNSVFCRPHHWERILRKTRDFTDE